jgi:hypothetical protein
VSSELQHEFSVIEQQRIRLLDFLKTVPSEKLFHKPSSDKWSVIEIISHLMTSEKLSLQYMKKKSLGIKSLKNYGWMERIKYALLKGYQKIHIIKFKAPSIVVSNMPVLTSLEEAIENWDNARNECRLFLETIPDQYAHRMIYRHPIVGLLGAPQAVAFLGLHVAHHEHQILKLI